MKYLSISKSSLPVGSAAGGLDAERARQFVPPLQGLSPHVPNTQGSGRSAAFTLGWAVARFQRTRSQA